MTNLTRTIPVGDGTPPMILTHSVKDIGRGKVRFALEAYDNRGDVQAYLILDDGDPVEMEKDGGSYRLTLSGNDLEDAGSYHFNVVDGAGLSTSTVEGKLDLGGGSPWAIILFAIVSLAVMVLIAAIFVIRMKRDNSEE